MANIDFTPINTKQPKIDFSPIDFEPIEEKKNLMGLATTPISKLVTGKTVNERIGIPQKQEKYMTEITNKAGLSGKPLSVGEAFMKGLPGQTAKVGVDVIDFTPLDVGIAAATWGAGKIPFKGVPLGEIASKIPLNKRFFQNIDEFSRYQQTLKSITPLSSRGVQATKELPKPVPVETPKSAENINLTKYPEDVRKPIADIVEKKPELGKTPKITDIELRQRAASLQDTPTVKYLATLPEGTVEAEALKVREGNVDSIRQALAGELGDLKNRIDGTIEEGINLHRKTAAMFGRGLRQQKLPAGTQQQMAFQIDDTIKRIERDPVFSKDKELKETLKKLRGLVVDKEFNPSLWNKTYFVWMNSILSNPWTHLVNTASNTLFTLAKIPEKAASAVMDLPLSLKTGKRTQFFGEIPAMIKGAFSKEALPQELMAGTKLDVMASPIRGTAGKVISAPTTLLQLEDNFAKNLIGKMEFAAQKYAGKTGADLTKSVGDEMLYRTFQNDPGMVAESVMLLRNRIPGLRYVLPFIKTPANLIARGLERTPLGLAKVAHKASQKLYTQEVLSKDLGNIALGTMGAGWIGLQWAKGNITGRVPTDAAERDAFYRQGKKPNSIKIGDNWIPFNRLEPIGTSISVMANMFEDYKNSKKETAPEKAIDAVTALGSTLINKTYLSGFTNMIQALSDPEMYGKGFLRTIASGGVPQLLKFFADLKDPYYREANSVLDYMKSKIPGASETLPAKLNAFGEPIKRDAFNIGKVNQDPLELMISETPVSFPGKTLGNEKLSPEEYRSIVETSGPKIKNTLLKLDPEKFMSLPVEVREKLINQIENASRQIPRAKIRANRLKLKFNQ